MHILQQKILDLAKSQNLKKFTLREIGEKVGDPHPQKIKHHLDQLFKKGLLIKDPSGAKIIKVGAGQNELFYSIPILGSANCGPATTLAEEKIEGYLTVSKNMLNSFHKNRTFAIRAIGNSMNRADIDGNNIEDGDYVIIDSSLRSADLYNNQYVLSIIGGLANIKKFSFDKKNGQIVLLSESTEEYPPIYIYEGDFQSYMVNGLVVKVIKKPVN